MSRAVKAIGAALVVVGGYIAAGGSIQRLTDAVSSLGPVPGGATGSSTGPRAVRNNNPLNIEIGDDWQGRMPIDQMTAEQRAETRFVVFAHPQWGFRAGAIILRGYQERHGLRTLHEMVSRWAPPPENNPGPYTAIVAGAIGIGAQEPFDVRNPDRMFRMLRSMSAVEAGGYFFDDADIRTGMALAGIGVGVV